jgi:hypothetical protein
MTAVRQFVLRDVVVICRRTVQNAAPTAVSEAASSGVCTEVHACKSCKCKLLKKQYLIAECVSISGL